MKKLVALLLAALLLTSVALAETVKMDKLSLEFVPSKDAEVIITGTKNLPDLLKAALLEQGYDVGQIDITVGTSYEATGEALSAGSIDLGWLPGGTYALYSSEVDVILTATRAGLSNDSTDPRTWNGVANKTLPTDQQVTFYRSLIYATPSEYGKVLAAKVNAGEALTWDDLSKANWAVLKNSSSAGYIYPTLWLMTNYEGKKLTDLPSVMTLSGYGDAFAQAAAEAVDIVVCYADGRRDYEAAWKLPTTEATDKKIQGLGRAAEIWDELNVIGVTDPIYNDTVSITKANPAVYNEAFIAAIRNALINVINTPEGKEIFNVYSHTGYAIAVDSDYNAARKALEAAK
jgi:phosphonate transport system substrate-binding protein